MHKNVGEKFQEFFSYNFLEKNLGKFPIFVLKIISGIVLESKFRKSQGLFVLFNVCLFCCVCFVVFVLFCLFVWVWV